MPGGSFPIDIIAGSDGGIGGIGWGGGGGGMGGMANWGWLGWWAGGGGGGKAPPGGGGKPCGMRTTLTMAGSSGGSPTETTGMAGIGG